MAKNIVPVLTRQELIDLFRREAKIGADGSVGFSRRGIARLIGVSKPAIQKILAKIGGNQKLSLELEDFTGQQFEVGNQIPDLLVSALIAHYSALGNFRCRHLGELPTVKRVHYDGGFWLRGGSPHSCLSTSTWSYIPSTSSLASS
jgi:hypothetical protein